MNNDKLFAAALVLDEGDVVSLQHYPPQCLQTRQVEFNCKSTAKAKKVPSLFSSSGGLHKHHPKPDSCTHQNLYNSLLNLGFFLVIYQYQ